MYTINEVFYSLQGEGVRAGTPNVFVRLSGCNLACCKEAEGFDCDTEFVSGIPYSTPEAVLDEAQHVGGTTKSVIFTGGEPGLQLDRPLVSVFKEAGWFVAVETNGTCVLPSQIDWLSVSPKTAEHALRVGYASELRYVRGANQGIPKPTVEADYYCLSPAFLGDSLEPGALKNCLALIKQHPKWRLSIQAHKLLGLR